ncbi:MAG: hypothetical protein JRJ60_05350 [Deltaproteobacteria bacterium]|nr:hypothetical protein [Deltaproteobacteria bacterium]
MIENKKEFFSGLAMMAGFIVVLVLFFSPIFGGHNGLDYLDNLYNSISKGSAYYIPELNEKVVASRGERIEATLNLGGKKQAEQGAPLFKAGGAETTIADGTLTVTGDLGRILANALSDADAMYHNRGKEVSDKYGYNERQVLYNWWKALQEMEKEMKRQENFKASDSISLVVKKGLETSYNYYQIEPRKIMDRFWLVVFSLVFYVVYTMWYGFAFMFMFEGWGMKLGH